MADRFSNAFERGQIAFHRHVNGDELWIDGVQVVAPPKPAVAGKLLGSQVHHYFAMHFREFVAAVRGRPKPKRAAPDGLAPDAA